MIEQNAQKHVSTFCVCTCCPSTYIEKDEFFKTALLSTRTRWCHWPSCSKSGHHTLAPESPIASGSHSPISANTHQQSSHNLSQTADDESTKTFQGNLTSCGVSVYN